MNKREFVDYAYKHCNKTVRKYDLEICTNIIIDALRDAMCEDNVSFTGFGSFGTITMKAKKLYNFKTKKMDVMISDRKIPRFTPSDKMRKYVNDKK